MKRLPVPSSPQPGPSNGVMGPASPDLRIQRTDYGSKIQLGISDPADSMGTGVLLTAIGPSTTSRAHFAIRNTTDTDYRVVLTNSPDGSAGSGGLLFGTGTAAPDVMLYRSGTTTCRLVPVTCWPSTAFGSSRPVKRDGLPRPTPSCARPSTRPR